MYALMMMSMAMMDQGLSQIQWTMVRYIGYANNAGGKINKGMDFVEEYFTICKFFSNISFFVSSLKRQENKSLRTGDGLTDHKQCAKTRREKKKKENWTPRLNIQNSSKLTLTATNTSKS